MSLEERILMDDFAQKSIEERMDDILAALGEDA